MGAGIGVLELEIPFSGVDKTVDLAGDLETDSVPNLFPVLSLMFLARCCVVFPHPTGSTMLEWMLAEINAPSRKPAASCLNNVYVSSKTGHIESAMDRSQ